MHRNSKMSKFRHFKMSKKFIKTQSIIPSGPCNGENFGGCTEAGKSKTTSTELLVEFLYSLMTKDYEKALNYCIQILNDEPNNSVAQEFYPLIVEKLEIRLQYSTSESSETRSTSSTSSESSIFHNEVLKERSSENSKSYSNHQEIRALEEINDNARSNPITAEPITQIADGNIETLRSKTISKTRESQKNQK